jgi:hypothetical protein
MNKATLPIEKIYCFGFAIVLKQVNGIVADLGGVRTGSYDLVLAILTRNEEWLRLGPERLHGDMVSACRHPLT